MEEFAKEALLYDFYGELLNDRQREVYDAYTMEDLSLAEIAEQYGISRQAVSTMVARCRKALKNYEDRLQLVKKFEDMKSFACEIRELSGKMDGPEAEKIMELADRILGDL
ncbi:hypothetical protein SAMN06296386_104287 [Lachnospiraceae bacterium]|nr:hypothetical protein SAMN06296386_104287 [Lachnospiraceae bacterium]